MNYIGRGLGLCVDLLVTTRGAYNNKCVFLSKDGRIGSIKNLEGRRPGLYVSDKPLLYFDSKVVALPSIVDIHVHLRGLRQRYKEDPLSGTAAAAASGIAIVADMPNTDPPLRDPSALKAKLEELESKAFVDFGVYAGVPYDINDIQLLASKEIIGFKIYPEDLHESEDKLCKLFLKAREKDLLVIVHPEDPDLIKLEEGWSRETMRGCHVEESSLLHVAEIAQKCGSPRLHITHVSCPHTLLKAQQMGFSVDVTPHHLLLDSEPSSLFSDQACLFKVNPPLRNSITRWNLFLKALVDDNIIIASDHAPHAPEEKSMHPLLCPPGVSSLEYWPRILIHLYSSMRISLTDLAKKTSKRPASLIKVSDRGDIAPGNMGDIVVYRLEDYERVVSPIYSKATRTPYFMLEASIVESHIIRGRLVYTIEDGLLVEPGFGENVAKLSRSRMR
ncbi:MAG: dihydroorotase [Pyrodictiaceae archaeon]